MSVALVRSSRIEPAFDPVVPLVETLTVQVAEGAPPEAVTEEIEGAVPESPLVARAKLETATPETGSEKVTVQPSGPAFTEPAPVRAIEESVGGVSSSTTVTELPGAETEVQLRHTATTRYVYAPLDTVVSSQCVDDRSDPGDERHAALGVEPR
jgi:hypothetical protein